MNITENDINIIMDDIIFIRKNIRKLIEDPIWRLELLKKSNNALDILSCLREK